MDDLKALMDVEKQHGARLRLRKNTARPDKCVLRLTGRDSRGNPVKAIGDEAFLCKLLLMFPSLRSTTPEPTSLSARTSVRSTLVDLKEHVKLENKNGGRLRVTENTQCPKDGPLRLTGRSSRGQRLKIVGDEEFIIRMILAGRAVVPAAGEMGLISAEEYATACPYVAYSRCSAM